MDKHLDTQMLKKSLHMPIPADLATAFEGLDNDQRSHLLQVLADVIRHEAEVLGYRIDMDRSTPVNEYSRWKTGEAVAKLIKTAADLLRAETVRQGITWD